MRLIWSAAAMVMLAVAMHQPLHAQSSRLEGGVSSQPGFDFHWETRLEPAMPPLSPAFGTAVLDTPPNSVHRVLLDRAQKVYFGYSARVDVLDGNTYRLTFSPLVMTPDLQRLLGDDGSWRPLPAPRFPEPRTVGDGDVLELPLLTNSGRGQRMTEYVSIQRPRPRGFDGPERRAFSFVPGTARDFALEDVALRLDRPVVRVRRQDSGFRTIDGRAVNRTASMQQHTLEGEAAGTIVWIYVPHQGRYLLSLVPRAQLGFRKAGEVRGTSLQFTVGATSIFATTSSAVAPGQHPYNLYVLFEAGWRPTYAHANVDVVQIGAADRAEYVLFRGNR